MRGINDKAIALLDLCLQRSQRVRIDFYFLVANPTKEVMMRGTTGDLVNRLARRNFGFDNQPHVEQKM